MLVQFLQSEETGSFFYRCIGLPRRSLNLNRHIKIWTWTSE
jgi:hypothetical protein